jgi:hypothetical protein
MMGMRIAQPLVRLALLLVSAPGCSHVTERRIEPARASAQEETPANTVASEDDLAMPHLLDAINAARQARGVPVLRIDRGLALVAQQAGADYQKLGRGFEQRVAARANAELRSFSVIFGHVVALVAFVERFDQARAALAPAMDPDMRFVGMSVVPPTTEQGGYAVVVTLGR